MRVAIVGLGLIGGSLARVLAARGYEVSGVDTPAARRRARAAGAIRHGQATPEAAAARADLLVLAAPPRVNLTLLHRVAPWCREGLVVTDVGSVKTGIQEEAEGLGLSRFVGGHPIAGSEGSGFGASSPGLFRGHAWVLTPCKDERALRLARRVVRAAGARPVLLDAADHDRILAFLSHLPQVLSFGLLEAAKGDPVTRRRLDLAGPGFRDMTRLAKSPRALWREIVGQNQSEVGRALLALEKALARVRRDLGA
jgi:prephenate dehydrogenase